MNTKKKQLITTLITTWVIGSAATSAAVYATEYFDYPNGDLTGANSGSGWNGPWANLAPGSATVTSNQLFTTAAGKRNAEGYRYLEQNWNGEKLGAPADTVYISWTTKLINDTDRSFQIGLAQNTGNGDDNRLNIGQDNSSANLIRAQIGKKNWNPKPGKELYFDGTTSYRFVLKVTDGGNGAADSFALFINPAGPTEPAEPYTTGNNLILNFNKIRFFAGNAKQINAELNAPAEGMIDNIQVSTDWPR